MFCTEKGEETELYFVTVTFWLVVSVDVKQFSSPFLRTEAFKSLELFFLIGIDKGFKYFTHCTNWYFTANARPVGEKLH